MSDRNKLELKNTIQIAGTEIFCIRFSPDGKFLAASCSDGSVRVFNASNGTPAFHLNGGSEASQTAITLKFRPITPSARTKNVFITSNSSGILQQWHMTSAKILHSFREEGNIVNAIEYNDEATKFITGGTDCAVRVYDEGARSLIQTMTRSDPASGSESGHTGRIFSCKAVPGDEYMFLTGGWDDTVQIWDIRVGMSVRSFKGPHICGDSLDMCGNDILTGSWRTENQLEIWDYGSGQKIRDVPWSQSSSSSSFTQPFQSLKPNSVEVQPPVCMVYATQFSKEGGGRYAAAGGSNLNEVKLFDSENNYRVVGSVEDLSHGVFTLDFSADNKRFAIATADSNIKIYEISE